MAFGEWVYTDALYMYIYMYIGGSFSELDERCERAERTNLSCVGFATVVFRSGANLLLGIGYANYVMYYFQGIATYFIMTRNYPT